jgi:hypothetical protein
MPIHSLIAPYSRIGRGGGFEVDQPAATARQPADPRPCIPRDGAPRAQA